MREEIFERMRTSRFTGSWGRLGQIELLSLGVLHISRPELDRAARGLRRLDLSCSIKSRQVLLC